MEWELLALPSGNMENGCNVPVSSSFQSCFQIASVKRISNSKHMHCHGASSLPQMLDSSLAPFRVSLKYQSGPVNQIAIKVDQGFPLLPLLSWALVGSLFSKYVLGLFFFFLWSHKRAHSCQGPENKVSYTGNLGIRFDSLQIEKFSLGVPSQKLHVQGMLGMHSSTTTCT